MIQKISQQYEGFLSVLVVEMVEEVAPVFGEAVVRSIGVIIAEIFSGTVVMVAEMIQIDKGSLSVSFASRGTYLVDAVMLQMLMLVMI